MADVSPITSTSPVYTDTTAKQAKTSTQTKSSVKIDSVAIGQNTTITAGQANSMVLERAYEKLRGIVSDAKSALGIAPDQQLDTSNDATANRIADFALGAFEKWRSTPSRAALSDEEARRQYVTFIGGAITEGITEAKNILGALNVLSPDISNNIQSISDIVQKRLDDFAANGK